MGIKIGIAIPVLKDPRNQTHIEAAQRYRDLYMGVLADPITLGKQFPSAYTSTIPNVTLLTDAELARINRTSDFFAINEYSGQISSPPAGGIAACVQLFAPIVAVVQRQKTSSLIDFWRTRSGLYYWSLRWRILNKRSPPMDIATQLIVFSAPKIQP
jgi:hypothetical protein